MVILRFSSSLNPGMRYAPEHKLESRRKVLIAAARAIRMDGPERISVASVMGEAGLTHGGFYAHFASKNALVAASIEFMFDETSDWLEKIIHGKGARTALAAYIDNYLSDRHCRTPDFGCPIAALGSEVPRLDTESRQAFARGMAQRQHRIADLLRQMDADNPEAAAQSIQSELLGALIRARLVKASEREIILNSSRDMLLQRFTLDPTA